MCGVGYVVTRLNFPFVAIVPVVKKVMELLRKKKVRKLDPWFIKLNIVKMENHVGLMEHVHACGGRCVQLHEDCVCLP